MSEVSSGFCPARLSAGRGGFGRGGDRGRGDRGKGGKVERSCNISRLDSDTAEKCFTSYLIAGRGDRGRGRGRGRARDDDKEWVPVTKLGKPDYSMRRISN